MDAFITYDVSGRQGEVKAAMLAKGYFDHWTAYDKTYYLPNTCLWKKNTEQSVALADMQSVIQNLNWNQPFYNQIRLERCIVVPSDPWTGIPGEARRN